METPGREWALVIAGGDPVTEDVAARLGNASWVVAADSGLDQAYRLGIRPDLVIGDMDSVSPAALDRAEREGITVVRHPRDKDASDVELAIDAVADHGLGRATIIGGTGGRMAHTFANALLLTRCGEVKLDWLTPHARISPLHQGEQDEYRAEDGTLLSILPIGGPTECTSTGLRWPLDGTSLTRGATRGLSNEIVAATATVSVIRGEVLAVHERNESHD